MVTLDDKIKVDDTQMSQEKKEGYGQWDIVSMFVPIWGQHYILSGKSEVWKDDKTAGLLTSGFFGSVALLGTASGVYAAMRYL